MNYSEKIKSLPDRFYQFGLTTAVKQIIMAFIRPFFQQDTFIIVIIPDRSNYKRERTSEVKSLTLEILGAKKAKISPITKHQLETPLKAGCAGFYIEKNNEIAGCAFTQSYGIYKFGLNGHFEVPNKVTVLKNLYVFGRFRGKGLADKFNNARIASIPEDHIPVGFVIPENRFAIRSLKKYGFIEVMQIQRTTWFRRYNKQRITELAKTEFNKLIVSGLE